MLTALSQESCLVGPLTTDGCSSLTDFACHCQKPGLVAKVTPCLQKSCDAADQAGAFHINTPYHEALYSLSIQLLPAWLSPNVQLLAFPSPSLATRQPLRLLFQHHPCHPRPQRLFLPQRPITRCLAQLYRAPLSELAFHRVRVVPPIPTSLGLLPTLRVTWLAWPQLQQPRLTFCKYWRVPL